VRYKIYITLARWFGRAAHKLYFKAVNVVPFTAVTGDDLDKVCSQYGVVREEGESDSSLRGRAIEYIQKPGGGL
jgi:hypothetical protein